jgi:hypothetical protein
MASGGWDSPLYFIRITKLTFIYSINLKNVKYDEFEKD